MALGRSSFFIIILTVIITSISPLHAKDDLAGIGIGTRTCSDFILETTEIMDSGELTERAVLNRAEYIGWATGFMTALNIRHYEKNNIFKDMDSFEKYNDVYNEIMGSCNYIDKEGLQNDFAFATFLIFHSLTQQTQ